MGKRPGSPTLLGKLVLEPGFHHRQGLIHLAGVRASGLGQIGAATAAAAHLLGGQLDQVAGVQAALDRIVDPGAIEPWLDKVASDDKPCQMFGEHYHELLNEPDWRETAQLVVDWLQLRIPPLQRATA